MRKYMATADNINEETRLFTHIMTAESGSTCYWSNV